MTLAEFLKDDANQRLVRAEIIRRLRKCGSYGKRGLFAEIAKKTGLTPAYIGQIFNDKKALTETFVERMAVYLGVSTSSLRGGGATSPGELRERFTFQIEKMKIQAKEEGWSEEEIEKAIKTIIFFFKNAPALSTSRGFSFRKDGSVIFAPAIGEEEASLNASPPEDEN